MKNRLLKLWTDSDLEEENKAIIQTNIHGNRHMTSITVIKQDAKGNELWRYKGRILKNDESRIIVEAFFDHQDMMIHGMPLQHGDRFIETYFTDRWYNLFEIHDGQDDHLRGWYINITFPAVFQNDTVSYKDLALDVLVFPDGKIVVLDEDEFEDLDIPPDVREKAFNTLLDIQTGIFDQGILDGISL